MNKQYSKHQIQEAAKHWQNVLRRMDESKSNLLGTFAEKSGNDVVFSNMPSNALTFERKMKDANDNYVKVVKSIPKKQTISQSNDGAIALALKALEEPENGLPCTIEKSTPTVQFAGNRRYITIHDFD